MKRLHPYVVAPCLAATLITSATPVASAEDATAETTNGPVTTTRDTTACDFRLLPPPPVDTSEVPRPGSTSPAPLPIPERPAGGPRMAECGVVSAAGFIPPAKIAASSWIVFDTTSGDVIAAKDPHGRYRPASIAKVLIALVALDELTLDQITRATFDDASIEGSRAGIVEDTEYDVKTLLLGLLLSSGNDCGSALIRLLGGEEATVKKVNALATKLGATDTRIVNPTGLDAPGQMTSAFDMALFYSAAFSNDTFRELASTRLVEMPGNKNLDIEGFTMSNDNQLLASNFDGALGGKTGYTDDARHTFAGVAERGGRRLGAVVLDTHIHEGQRAWEQSADLLEAGFATPAHSSIASLTDLPDIHKSDSEKADKPLVDIPLLRDADTGTATSMFAITTVVLALVVAIGVRWGLRKRRPKTRTRLRRRIR